MKSPYKGLRRIFKAFGYSRDGFVAAFKSEAAFRQDIVFCLVFGASLFFLPFRGCELALMISSLILILLAELINTAIEVIIDRISEDYHPLSKTAKDIGSLLVLISFINMAVIWLCLLSQKYL